VSGTQKKSFASFLSTPAKPLAEREEAPPPAVQPQLSVVPPEGEGRGGEPAAAPPPAPPPAAAAADSPPAAPERIRQVTSTGRVRTHSANRQLPGVTLRLPEDRWERLKMLSLQERRPIQEILGDAMEAYMKTRGLPW
jgi:predicted DNA-binding protein